jgi:hypothetical protein
MRVRIVNTGSEPVTVPITPAQEQLEAILETAGWLKVERLHTGLTFTRTLNPGEQANYPVDRFTHAQLDEVEALNAAGKIEAFIEASA